MKNRFLSILILLLIGASAVCAQQEPPVYPNTYWVNGVLSYAAGSTATDLSGYKVVVYKVAGNDAAAFAAFVTGADGSFAVNPFDDQRFSPQPGADYYIGVTAKTAADGKSYGVNETKINFGAANQGYYTINLTLAAGQGVPDPEGPPVPPVVPEPPTGLTATGLTPTSESLSWSAAAGATSYIISLGSDAAGTNLGTVTTADPSYVWSGLTANTKYNWSVKAANASGTSASSALANFTTLAAPPAIPAAPTGLTATGLTPTSESLSWSAAAGATSYIISLGSDAAGTDLGTVTTANANYIWSGLTANKTYYWSVKAANASGTSVSSVITNFLTLPLTGVVPLDIVSSGGDVVLTWDKAAYPSVDVYRLLSDDSDTAKLRGQYSKNYPGTDKGSLKGWELVSAANTTGQYTEANYVAAGPLEAYYKALVAGADPAVNIPLAQAYGKYDLNLAAGFNLVSTPLVPLHGSAIDNVFVNAAGGGLRSDQEQVYYFDETSLLTVKALYNGTNKTWLYFPNTPFTVSPGNGYWVRETAAANRVSSLGSVINAANHRNLGLNFSLIGSPLPTYLLDLSAIGLGPTGLNEIYYYHDRLQDKLINKNGAWINVVPGGSVFGLYPGVGYWYRNNSGAALDWTLNP